MTLNAPVPSWLNWTRKTKSNEKTARVQIAPPGYHAGQPNQNPAADAPLPSSGVPGQTQAAQGNAQTPPIRAKESKMKQVTFDQLPAMVADSFGLIPYEESHHLCSSWNTGYLFTLPNGFQMSIQCGPATYSTHHDSTLDLRVGRGKTMDYISDSYEAEVAIWDKDHRWYTENMKPCERATEVIAYQSVEDVLNLMERVLALE
jgi:hypothetical protein